MTDPELLEKRLALIETCVQELRTLARVPEIAHAGTSISAWSPTSSSIVSTTY